MNHSNELQSSRIAPEIESASSGGNRRFAFSLHVAFEHEQKLLKLCFGFPLVSRKLDATLHVRVDQLFGERFKCSPCGDQLGQRFSAITILDEHAIDRSELATYLAQAQAQRLPLRFGMKMGGL